MLSSIENFDNLHSYVSRFWQQNESKEAYRCLGHSKTFSEIDDQSTKLAAYFQSIGLKQGDRIAIQLPNVIDYPIATYAAFKAGLVLVNTNPLYTPREMQHQFSDSGANAIVIMQALLPKLSEVIKHTSIGHIIVTSTSAELEAVKGVMPISIEDAIAQGNGEALELSSASLDDLALLQYTGGTTGVSKGAELTHRNVIANALQIEQRLGDTCSEGGEIFVCPLPLYHIYAFTVNMVLFASKANLNILIPNPRDLAAFIDDIKGVKFTGFSGINTLFVGLCMQSEFKALDFSGLKLTISGGTALTHSAANTWTSVTGCSISEGYGLSETAPALALNAPGQEEIGTVGWPVEDTVVELWDDNDQAVADGESGQVVAKGPQVMRGYWNMPEETAKVLTADGFFKTGDVGIKLPDGKIKIIDRLKDMIIVSGFNVYPNEVEDVLVSHPSIVEAAVVGKPCDKTGEKVHAFITVNGEVAPHEVIEYCKSQLTNYKVPKEVSILAELPKSTVGKILRRELRS